MTIRSLGAPLLAVATGVLGGMAFFPGAPGTVMAFLVIVPLLLAVRGARPPKAFLLGWLAGLTGVAVSIGWLSDAVALLQHSSRVFGVAIVAGISAYSGLQLALFATVVSVLATRSTAFAGYPPSAATIAAAWVLLDWAFPKVVPWSLGDMLGNSPILRQGAALGGVHLLGGVVAFCSASFAALLAGSPGRTARRVVEACTAAACLAGLAAYGVMATGTGTESARRLRLAIVQGGLEPSRDHLATYNDTAWRTYAGLTGDLHREGDAAHPLDLVLWPETTLTVFLRHDHVYRGRVLDLLRTQGVPLLVGSADAGLRGSDTYNAAHLIEPTAPTAWSRDGANRQLPRSAHVQEGWQVYRKRRLLPFGEYVPAAALISRLFAWRPAQNFEPADDDEPALLELSPNGGGIVRLAPSICYEATWPGAFNRQVRDGAELLVNVTDDSWFGRTAEPAQHLRLAVLRAVETRRWLVRASNSGISAFIDPFGRVVASLPVGAAATLRHQVDAGHALTPYVRFGDWPILAAALILTLWSVAAQLVTARGHRRFHHAPAHSFLPHRDHPGRDALAARHGSLSLGAGSPP
jgi:apolipoprotein N-acyltransferase